MYNFWWTIANYTGFFIFIGLCVKNGYPGRKFMTGLVTYAVIVIISQAWDGEYYRLAANLPICFWYAYVCRLVTRQENDSVRSKS